MISRRTAILAGLALGSVAHARGGEPLRAPAGKSLPVNGTHLYVEDTGPRNAPALVYLHGGPGVGCCEFSAYAASVLAKDWRLVAFDQRGVLRSDPLSGDAKFGVDDIVADIEALRIALGIGRWSILGHSFGGHFALRYALRHPDRVETMFLENPCYSYPESARSKLRSISTLCERLGLADLARKATALASSGAAPRELLDESLRIMSGLGEDRQQLYLYDQHYRGFFGRLEATSGIPEARWAQGQTQATMLFEDGHVFEPMLASMRAWRGKVLLMKGQTDSVTSQEEADTVAGLPQGRVVSVPRAGHFIHVEQPTLLAASLAATTGK